MTESRAPGLRLQIVLSLAGLMLLAFVPLFFAVASLARATLAGANERAARDVAQAVAAHVGDPDTEVDGIRRRALQHVGREGVEALRVYGADGALLVETTAEKAPEDRPRGRLLDVRTARGPLLVVATMRLDEEGEHATPLVRLVALYMITFAIALITFAYFALTRLIVRPIDGLVRAADRVASGARSLSVPRTGARELAELGASVQAMTASLLAEEAKMRAKVEELTQTTKRLTEARAMVARSERMASVGRLAAGVAHEIGNPIAALMGMEELLTAGDLPPEVQKDFLERMRRETERIHNVVRDLLDFARPEEPESSAPATKAPPAVVRAVVEDVRALVGPQKPFKSIEVKVDVDDALMVVLPAPRLTQVLLNIVLNAGAAIASKSREGAITVRARKSDGNVRIEVDDTGPGIPEDLRDRVFEPFVTTKEVGMGTGLGLAVCRGLVEGAGGEIGVDASYVSGARFYVVLPTPVEQESRAL